MPLKALPSAAPVPVCTHVERILHMPARDGPIRPAARLATSNILLGISRPESLGEEPCFRSPTPGDRRPIALKSGNRSCHPGPYSTPENRRASLRRAGRAGGFGLAGLVWSELGRVATYWRCASLRCLGGGAEPYAPRACLRQPASLLSAGLPGDVVAWRLSRGQAPGADASCVRQGPAAPETGRGER